MEIRGLNLRLRLRRRRLLLLLLLLCVSSTSAGSKTTDGSNMLLRFAEAAEYRNADVGCPRPSAEDEDVCSPDDVHIAMTLDVEYIRGSIAAVHSILRHSSCPKSIFFHFLASHHKHRLHTLLLSTFPSLRFRVYPFAPSVVSALISPSVREALESPLNYARNHIADVVDPCVRRVLYLDSDVLLVDDVRGLWETPMPSPTVVAAPEYCHVNFTRYFTDEFWADAALSATVRTRRKAPCYFNTGVMLLDLWRWRRGRYGRRIRRWMEVQRNRRIYHLGSLPPFLLVFAGQVKGVDHRWNQHGLGGDNLVGACRSIHPGPVSLLHWSGKGKPWARLDARTACPVDHLWAPYDLYLPPQPDSPAAPSTTTTKRNHLIIHTSF